MCRCADEPPVKTQALAHDAHSYVPGIVRVSDSEPCISHTHTHTHTLWALPLPFLTDICSLNFSCTFHYLPFSHPKPKALDFLLSEQGKMKRMMFSWNWGMHLVRLSEFIRWQGLNQVFQPAFCLALKAKLRRQQSSTLLHVPLRMVANELSSARAPARIWLMMH